MKKFTRRLVAVLVILLAGYLVYFELLLPKYAATHIPTAWRDLDISETRAELNQKLGVPAAAETDSDTWKFASCDDEYSLRVKYNQQQRSYKADVRYRYQLWQLQRNYRLKTEFWIP